VEQVVVQLGSSAAKALVQAWFVAPLQAAALMEV
jgi:hypothetical protein